MHTMWSGKSLPLLRILPFGMVCLYDVCKNYVGSVYGGLSKCGLCELCPVSFLVISESPSVLL